MHTVKTTLSALAQATTASGSDLLPPLRNPPLLEATEDLTNLSYLNEPAGELGIFCSSQELLFSKGRD